ncbi:MAG TPA: hypothetical protein VFC15_08085 [Candidatus Limnocylindrales bacterium]|nr:hypothetical protein [Candidatus Limnocylindrales bacterium]
MDGLERRRPKSLGYRSEAASVGGLFRYFDYFISAVRQVECHREHLHPGYALIGGPRAFFRQFLNDCLNEMVAWTTTTATTAAVLLA